MGGLSDAPGRVVVRVAGTELQLAGISPAAWSAALQAAGPDGIVEVFDGAGNLLTIPRAQVIASWTIAAGEPAPVLPLVSGPARPR